jgi:hypothetical protein
MSLINAQMVTSVPLIKSVQMPFDASNKHYFVNFQA